MKPSKRNADRLNRLGGTLGLDWNTTRSGERRLHRFGYGPDRAGAKIVKRTEQELIDDPNDIQQSAVEGSATAGLGREPVSRAVRRFASVRFGALLPPWCRREKSVAVCRRFSAPKRGRSVRPDSIPTRQPCGSEFCVAAISDRPTVAARRAKKCRSLSHLLESRNEDGATAGTRPAAVSRADRRLAL
jgi:hypothetical protein